jgi:formate hydrogenlyase subunit 6/NADH:ubiquinone oxidoreductase subunit I
MLNMFGNIIKNVASKPSTRLYPVEKRKPFSNTRGHMEIDINKCIFCGICSKKCPTGAITVNKQEASWEIDHFKCIICAACADACPKKCVSASEEYFSSAYVKSKNKYYQPIKQDAPQAAKQAETQQGSTDSEQAPKGDE